MSRIDANKVETIAAIKAAVAGSAWMNTSSAIGARPVLRTALANVRYWLIADIQPSTIYVRL